MGRESGQTTSAALITDRRAFSICRLICRAVENGVCPKADAEAYISANVGPATEGLSAPPREAMGGRHSFLSRAGETAASLTTSRVAPRSFFGSVARGLGREAAGPYGGCPCAATTAVTT